MLGMLGNASTQWVVVVMRERTVVIKAAQLVERIELIFDIILAVVAKKFKQSSLNLLKHPCY